MNSNVSNFDSFVVKQLELLELERDAEIEENKGLLQMKSIKSLQKKGACLTKLCLSDTSSGLFGRSILTFQSYCSNAGLPSNSISSGDIVGIGNLNNEGKIEIVVSGVVIKITEASINVAFEKNSDFSEIERDVNYLIIKIANDITYKRIKRTLKILLEKGRDFPLVNVLFGERNPASLEKSLKDLTFYNSKLNDTQKEAVEFALSQKEIAVLHGPPGTGKTTTVVECILQAVSQKLKILACAPSNVAVDNLVEKLSPYKIKIVRLGHPARFLPTIQHYSLDAIVARYDGSNVVEELHKEINHLTDRISKTKGSKNRKSMWAENRSLLKEVKEREIFIVKQILKNADVVLCTLTSASDDGSLKYVEKDHFDICVIDECSQAIEAACWIPLLLVKKCILAGDHHQLPPTIVSHRAAKEGLVITLMERLLKLYGEGIKKMLTIQYRMNTLIMQWPSQQLYENKLVADDCVSSHLLNDLPGIEDNENTSIPLLLIDTSGCYLPELHTEDDESKGNEGEADLVVVHTESLIRSGLSPENIAVITPYNLQVDIIKSRLSFKYPELEIKSVDSFQGREKEAVILSLVRSNESREIGFLSEDRRINVAITRAKRHLAVICDCKTVSNHPFLKSFISFCEEKGEVRSAHQYESEIGNYPSVSIGQKSRKSTGKKSDVKKRNEQKIETSSSAKIIQKDKSFESEEQKRFTEEKYLEIIENFQRSKNSSFMFPSTVCAYERRIIHELSEKLGLIHVSTGEGENRSLTIRKRLIAPVTDLANQTMISQSIPTSDNCEMHNSKKVHPVQKLKEKAKVKQQLTKPKLKTLKDSLNPEDDEFDSLLEQAMKADKICSYERCKKSIAALVQVCNFCKKRFCFEHFIPEVHGCGNAAKAAARSQIRKNGTIYPGSGLPERKIDPMKQTYLQKKLDKKLNELSSKRKPKPKS